MSAPARARGAVDGPGGTGPEPCRRERRAIAGPALGLAITALLAGDARGQTPMERLEIEANGFVFEARAAGPEDGPLVLMLHGFPQSSFEWRRQMPALAALGFRVVAPDQRGYSPRARPDEVEAYAIPHLVGDVLAIAEALGHERFHLVGHDWGGAVAWFTAMMRPGHVLSLVSVSTPHPFAFSRALSNPGGEQAGMSGYMTMLRSDSAEALLLADDAAALRGIYEGAGLTGEEIDVYVDLLGSPEAIGAALHWYRAMVLPTRQPPVSPVRVPTMYVWSTDDIALGREAAELTAEFVEGPYRFEVLEGVGHWVPEEAAGRLNGLLAEHLAPYAP